MNCFQKLLSSWRGTTVSLGSEQHQALWIAFKNYYLRDEEQLGKTKGNHFKSCELLSKIIIFVTRNNQASIIASKEKVVNCFQKLLSSWRGTTMSKNTQTFAKLWIAFKNYYLRDEEQQNWISLSVFPRCELLSKIIIFVTRNNRIFIKW